MKCLEFLTKEEVVPARGGIIDVTNLARLYVGEPIAETISLRFMELRQSLLEVGLNLSNIGLLITSSTLSGLPALSSQSSELDPSSA